MNQPPNYPPPPDGYGYPPPPSEGYGYQSATPGGYGYPPPWPQYPQSVGTNGFAVASIICAAVGLACMGTGSVLGIIFGIVALNQIKRTGQNGRGLAISGIVVGGIVTAGWVLVIILGGLSAALDSNKDNHHDGRYDSSPPTAVQSTVEAQPMGLVYSR